MEPENGNEAADKNQLQLISPKESKPIETKVKVALRVRPMVAKEIASNEQKCVACDTKTNQVRFLLLVKS